MSIASKAAEKSITVNAPVADVYEHWLRFEELPKLIKSLGNVERIDGTHFSFRNIRDGKEHRGVIEVIQQIPERRIVWRTIADGLGLGVVSFEPRSEKATEVTLKLRSVFDSSIAASIANEYLLNFKRLIEDRQRLER
ncbi:MAG TPA: SRPBCC family protein [Candidatus Udaeobacter sp.]|nr:SRPBCC family protein [Candidatus Udaeobacter sp.]